MNNTCIMGIATDDPAEWTGKKYRTSFGSTVTHNSIARLYKTGNTITYYDALMFHDDSTWCADPIWYCGKALYTKITIPKIPIKIKIFYIDMDTVSDNDMPMVKSRRQVDEALEYYGNY